MKKFFIGAIFALVTCVVALIFGNLYKSGTFGASNFRTVRPITVLDAVTSPVTGNWYPVKDANDIIAIVTLENSATATVKFICTFSETAVATSPSTTVTSTASNQYSYIQATDLQSGETIDGLTGLVATNSTTQRTFRLNTDLATFCTARATAQTSGTSTVQMVSGDNQ